MEKRVLEIINLILTNKGAKKVKEFNPAMRLTGDIGFDSMDLAELTVRIEAEYDVDIFANGIIHTIDEVIQKIKK